MIGAGWYMRNLIYRDAGRVMPYADCWQLVWLVYHREAGIDLESYDHQSLRQSGGGNIAKLIREEAQNYIPVAIPREFDLVTMARGRAPTHIGVMVDGESVMHMHERAGVVVHPLDRTDQMAMKVCQVYRHKALA